MIIYTFMVEEIEHVEVFISTVYQSVVDQQYICHYYLYIIFQCLSAVVFNVHNSMQHCIKHA